MRTRAAVLYGPNTDYVVEEIELDPPKAGEVLVRFAASGMCHSDEHLVTGSIAMDEGFLELLGWQQYPIIAGHEGAGVVVEIGDAVTTLVPGDHVVTSFVPACGRCPACTSGHQNLCDLGAYVLSGHLLDGTSRHHTLDGRDIATMCCLGTFAEHSVVPEPSLVKIDPDLPLDRACLVACGVTTGWASATYAADVAPGETVVVIGAGGVGMNAIQGAAMAGARAVVALDPVEFKRQQAATFGATDTAATVAECQGIVGRITAGRNADKVIVTVGEGDGADLASYMTLLGKGGRLVFTSSTNIAARDVQLDLFDLTMLQKSVVGAIFGSANPRYDIPRLLGLYRDGQLLLDELVTRTYALDQLNQGYQDLRDGLIVRGVVVYD